MAYYINNFNQKIAYKYTKGKSPGIIFVHGLNSDMQGIKALSIERYAKKNKLSFLRFDCRGHGKSFGKFENLSQSIGARWEESTRLLLEMTTCSWRVFTSPMTAFLETVRFFPTVPRWRDTSRWEITPFSGALPGSSSSAGWVPMLSWEPTQS